MVIDYYETLKTHYSTENITGQDKSALIAELQTDMQNNIENNLITEYDLRIGIAEYRRNAKVNFTKDIILALKDERYKEPVYDALALSCYTSPNECDSGDYITMTIRDTEDVYLVRAEPDKRRNHDKLMLLECQYNVKILDDDGIRVHNYPMFFQDNKSRPQVSERAETGVTENSTFQAYVKHDAISRRFIDVTGTKVNGQSNKIMRILIDGLAYKIAGSDPVTAKGLITLGLELDNKTPNDNLELGIADYYDNVATEPEPPADLVINWEWDDIEFGGTNIYTIDTNNTVTWGLTNNGNGVTLGLTGVNGECTVTCDKNTKLIGNVETLTAYLDYGATVAKEIPIVGVIEGVGYVRSIKWT